MKSGTKLKEMVFRPSLLYDKMDDARKQRELGENCRIGAGTLHLLLSPSEVCKILPPPRRRASFLAA